MNSKKVFDLKQNCCAKELVNDVYNPDFIGMNLFFFGRAY